MGKSIFKNFEDFENEERSEKKENKYDKYSKNELSDMIKSKEEDYNRKILNEEDFDDLIDMLQSYVFRDHD